MTWFDIVNALFETFGAYAAWQNFFRLRREREVKGVVWELTGVYAVWGIWNVLFYPLVGAWASAVMGAIMTSANVAWVILAYKLTRPRAEPHYEYRFPPLSEETRRVVLEMFDDAPTLRFKREDISPALLREYHVEYEK